MCRQCKIALTYHKSKNKLVCHFCSFFVKNETLICQECGNPNLIYSGTGTQKVEQLIRETFPKIKNM